MCAMFTAVVVFPQPPFMLMIATVFIPDTSIQSLFLSPRPDRKYCQLCGGRSSPYSASGFFSRNTSTAPTCQPYSFPPPRCLYFSCSPYGTRLRPETSAPSSASTPGQENRPQTAFSSGTYTRQRNGFSGIQITAFSFTSTLLSPAKRLFGAVFLSSSGFSPPLIKSHHFPRMEIIISCTAFPPVFRVALCFCPWNLPPFSACDTAFNFSP